MREILGVLVPFFAIVALGYRAAILSSTVISVASLAFVVWLLARA
jgi:hypothetical protein